jgi:hypothetical protein
MSSANTPWFVDILEAMLEAQLSYMHLVGIGMRWHIGGKFRPAESFFELLTKAKDEGGVNILQIQFDIAITTHHTDEERSENRALHRLPKWRTGTGRPHGDSYPLGRGLTRARYPLWNFSSKDGYFSNQQSGTVTLAFSADRHGSYLTPESKGISQVKCYITAAHVSRNALPRLPNPNWDLLPETIMQIKRMMPLMRRVAIEVLDDENVLEYGHRCEITYQHRRHIQINEWVTLEKLMRLALYGRGRVLQAYSVEPVPYDELPENNELRVRAMIIIGQITREVVGNRHTTLIKRIFGDGKKKWLKGMLAQLYICCGLTGRKVTGAFRKWINGGRTMYDPDGYRLLWDPPLSFDSVTDASPMNREGNPIPHLALQFCEKAKLARMDAAVQEQVQRLTRPARMEYLGNIGDLLDAQIQSAIRLAEVTFLNRMNRGSLPYFAPTIFDEDDELEEEDIEDTEDIQQDHEDMNDHFLDEAAATEQEAAERAAIYLPRIFPEENNGVIEVAEQDFPEIDSFEWWNRLCLLILGVEQAREPRVFFDNDWVIQWLNEGQDPQTARPFWRNAKLIERLARMLDVHVPRDNRRRENLMILLADHYNFYPDSGNDQMDETHV